MSYNEPFAKPSGRLTGPGAGSGFDELLLRIVDGGLAGCIFVVPFLMGGRQALGQLALVTLAVVVALAWVVRQCLRREGKWRWSGAELLLSAGVALVLVQLAPLPPWLSSRLAPHTAEVLPLWSGQGETSAGLGTWCQVSLTPAATRAGLMILVAYGLLFLTTVQRIRNLEDVERLLRWCALSACAVAAFGLVQFLTSNNKFFWFYEHPYSRTSDVVKGSFTNRNHFAHFLALGIGPLIWWVQGEGGRRKGEGGRRKAQGGREKGASFNIHHSSFGWLALVLVLFAGLMSLSRGGLAAMFLSAAICLAVCYLASSVGIRLIGSLAAAAVLIGAALTIHGYDRVATRMDTLTSGSMDTMDKNAGRRTIWNTVLKAVPDYAVAGSGVGSLREVYPMYLGRSAAGSYCTHAENGYLQVLLECGAVGLALVLAGVGLCGYWCVGGLRRATSNQMLLCVGAVSAGLAASAVHSLIDFVWYVPACMAIVAVLAASACRLRQLARDEAGPRVRPVVMPRYLGLATAVLLAVVGTWMVSTRIGPVVAEGHWHRFRMLKRAASRLQPPRNPQSETDPAETASPEQVHGASMAAQSTMVSELETVVYWDPDHARAHLELADAYLLLFDLCQETSQNRFPVSQIRDVAVGSFRSREALQEWLSRAVGDHCRCLYEALGHTRRALSLCPLLGKGYLHLAQLCFLEGKQAPANAAFVEQALKVRPCDGTVLFHAGQEAWLAGNYELGMEFWWRSFHGDRRHQQELIDRLTGNAPPEAVKDEIEFFVQFFQPDLYALKLLHRRCGRLATPEGLVPLRRYCAQVAEAEASNLEGEDARDKWMDAHWFYTALGDVAAAVTSARQAMRCDPNDFRVRRKLAFALIDRGEFAEAERHLRWCLTRRPASQPLQDKLLEVARRRIGGEERTASPGGSSRQYR